ncbi:MAG: hypothetical protein ABSB59_11780 [Streptosporangiaceae bacterium]|jgi:hypothetical protein
MTRFTDRLWDDLVSEHGPALALAARPGPDRTRHPHVLAGSTLALAGAGTALALGLTATGSTPAFAVTKNADGSVLVNLNQITSLPHGGNAKLAAMGVGGLIISMAGGPATVSGPVTCTRAPGATGPVVKILVGKDGTEVIAPGTTGGNTGVGTWHLASCQTTGPSTGNTGSGNTGAG